MEELDLEQLDKVAGGRQIYQGSQGVCYVCGKKSDELNSVGIGFCEIFYKDGMRKVCPSCYEKFCSGDLN